MASRDLTSTFVRRRSAKSDLRRLSGGAGAGGGGGGGAGGSQPRRHYHGREGLLGEQDTPSSTVGAGGWGAAAGAHLPPAWVDRVDAVDEVVKTIQLKMRDLSALHTKRLMVTFDDASELDQEREIESLTQGITKLFRQAEKELMRIKAEGAGSTGPTAELAVKNNIQRAAARKLQNLSMAFRSSQKDYLRRLRAQKEGGDDFDFLKDDEASASKRPAGGWLGAGAVDQVQLAVLEDTETYVKERDTEIRNIVKNIEELGTIFKELAVLVIDQGTVLDRIDYNMEQVVERTAEGVTQLRRAEQHQKNAMPVKCIAVLLLLIAIMIVILALKHSR